MRLDALPLATPLHLECSYAPFCCASLSLVTLRASQLSFPMCPAITAAGSSSHLTPASPCRPQQLSRRRANCCDFARPSSPRCLAAPPCLAVRIRQHCQPVGRSRVSHGCLAAIASTVRILPLGISPLQHLLLDLSPRQGCCITPLRPIFVRVALRAASCHRGLSIEHIARHCVSRASRRPNC